MLFLLALDNSVEEEGAENDVDRVWTRGEGHETGEGHCNVRKGKGRRKEGRGGGSGKKGGGIASAWGKGEKGRRGLKRRVIELCTVEGGWRREGQRSALEKSA